MNRLIAAALVLFLFVSNAPSASASEFGYELKVKGMVCAFCAYSVSRQLRSADGVVADSVEVDLAVGTITLESEKPLEAALLAELVEAAGFELEAVAESAPDSSITAPSSERGVLISLTLDAKGVADGEFEALLQALGTFVSQRSAGLDVVAPAGLEMLTLRPILMGRTPAIDVGYSEGIPEDNTVLIEVLAD